MKIWIDLANSPQVLFFHPIIREFKSRGHETIITTRAYAQTVQLANKYRLQHTVIGKHGGNRTLALIQQLITRSLTLSRWAKDIQLDLVVSHNSYSQIVAAKLLGIPSVTLMDYEHQPLNHMCFRLAKRVIVPEVFPKAAIDKFGAHKKTLSYRGIKEQVYLADFVPQTGYRKNENLPVEEILIVVRPPAPWTAYHRFENDLFDILLSHLSSNNGRYVLFLPRIESQKISVEGIAGIHVAEKVYDGPNLLYHADLVISGGGTMNRESAILGTPTYTVFKGKLGAVDQYLINNDRLYQIKDVEEIAQILLFKKKDLGKNNSMIKPELVGDITDMILDSI